MEDKYGKNKTRQCFVLLMYEGKSINTNKDEEILQLVKEISLPQYTKGNVLCLGPITFFKLLLRPDALSKVGEDFRAKELCYRLGKKIQYDQISLLAIDNLSYSSNLQRLLLQEQYI